MTLRQHFIDQTIIACNTLAVSLPLRQLGAVPHLTISTPPSRFLIIPGDVRNPSGSLGDMAMFTALLQSLRARDPAATFTIIGTRNHSISVPGIGVVPVVAAWTGRTGVTAFDSQIRQHHALFVMGADILDGQYGAALVQRIVDYCNHSVQLGIPATMLGFSFNSHPRQPAVHALSRLHPKVTVNVRDQPSLDRFTQIVGIPATLCADSAFLMPPAAESDPEAETWISAMRDAGRHPVGINLNAHAMAPALAQISTTELIARMAEQLVLAGDMNKLAFMLIPHDFKLKSGDAPMLLALEKQLKNSGFPHVCYTSIDRPDKIKRITSLLDFIITGRMHLAIAALGSGTPILSITYQDKFEGLYQHFGLPLEDTLSPMHCISDEFLGKLNHAFMQRHDNRERIRTSLPQVTQLAARNLVIAGV
jgi:polysaccharide pyruvyl transferase WcaK-like protein